MDIVHVPVLVKEVLEFFKDIEGVFLDCTVGLGGHAEAILTEIPNSTVVGLDVDEEALELARKRLERFLLVGRARLFKSSYVDAVEVLKNLGFDRVDAILMDLGVSSMQLERAERGFSFNRDGPLDMRMDKRQSLTAYEIVNLWNEEDLSRIIFEYGEEKRYARRIARFIVRSRPIETTKQLVEVLARAIPNKHGRKRHFATRVFQAIRIAVNSELENLKKFLAQVPELLKPGGRIAIVSFHSLEDRIVKEFFRSESSLKQLTKKPITPSEFEITLNPRARSAKLRVAERV
ncbi:MAG: Ribosomal RNA small subunit methyltransferase H [Thermotoga sp. 50_1627]|uniref:16S rRNA (cytosine(1402)-N(4))-methyltransferase RsmH n=1 Tax=Pseudothermotoga sp. TaxID=2033661 RepID=UPI00076D751F|nr:MAG: Ribosomal RNA small subunit methyltransferase H [Thermotoga sp. 50_64]KUK25498.1 MAG: Ribosomal RNA small subunit methyltransferase H [Thermotoga sp. 50_1627]MBC7115773.1 16S rRNA (cytosine(1402)-N(4))-methyltransferase RsmH [Pseudothermotoga sp.]MDK2922989.1 rRNA (cytosine1402-N4)-methyltransferase [Pseudothermotoga sp.]HBT38962.1 16S rRNA (cytosine(1402)-N(4))-methyltransferase [Pseudothermotoga sp.]